MHKLWHYIICLSLFGCHQNVSTVQTDTMADTNLNSDYIPNGKGFYVANAKLDYLSDATVHINGALIPYDSLYQQYLFPENTAQPYQLNISHPVAGNWTNDKMYYDSGTVYLLDEDDAYYWQGGVKVPVIWEENVFYLMLFNEHTFSNDRRLEIDLEINTLLKEYDSEIIPVALENDFNQIFFRKIVFAEKLKKIDLIEIYTLFKNYERTQFFGPYLKNKETQDYQGLGLSQTIEIRFSQKLSPAQQKELFDHFNLKLESTSYGASSIYTKVSFTEIYGCKKIIKQTDALNEHALIRSANNQLFIIETN